MFEFLNGKKTEQNFEEQFGKKIITIEYRERGSIMYAADGDTEVLYKTPWNHLLSAFLSREYFYRCMVKIASNNLDIQDGQKIVDIAGRMQHEGFNDDPVHVAFESVLKDKNGDYIKDFG